MWPTTGHHHTPIIIMQPTTTQPNPTPEESRAALLRVIAWEAVCTGDRLIEGLCLDALGSQSRGARRPSEEDYAMARGLSDAELAAVELYLVSRYR